MGSALLSFLTKGSPKTPDPERLPTSRVVTNKLITYYQCGHVHTATAPEIIQTQNLHNTRGQNHATTMNDPSSCPSCRKRLESELRQAAEIQSIIRASAERTSWKEGKRNPAPPTKGVAETIYAVLSSQQAESLESLRRAQVNGLKSKNSKRGETTFPASNPWGEQSIIDSIAQRMLGSTINNEGESGTGLVEGENTQTPPVTHHLPLAEEVDESLEFSHVSLV